ncbi:MAG TPA: hypothetical protein G4O07_08720 [Dehalococcoidia bacterium]|nr:hypothetical protein [Dehalococcoidia bacterium]
MVETKKVIAGDCLTVGTVKLVPIVKTVARCRSYGPGITGFGSSDVLGIVVLSAEATYAIDVSGERVPVEHYLELVPELAEMLQKHAV